MNNNVPKNSIDIYSSNKIDKGTFVSTSKMMADDYTEGTGNVYKKHIDPVEVAWITGDEGIYVGHIR